MTDQRAIMAAQNNADWYAMMFDVHGLRYRRSDIAFLAIDKPPPYHSRMTTVDPLAQEQLLQLISQNIHCTGFGVKDAFNCLQLESQGMTALFSANWIYADRIQSANTNNWVQIHSLDDLLLWENAWKAGGSPSNQTQFPKPILSRNDVFIWGRRSTTGFDAGVIANVSTDCVGLSNCFGQDAFPAAAALCAQLASSQPRKLPIVGYERGDDLDAALQSGFTTTGNLRVWVKQKNTVK